MKRIKLFFAAVTLCAATFVGYSAYRQATMTEQERLMQANLEALSNDESGGKYTGCAEGVGYCAIYYNGICIFESNEHYPRSL